MKIEKLLKQINELLTKKESIVIAIDGCSNSGKTSMASELSKFFDANIIHIDDFFLPKNSKIKNSEFDGNIDYDRFKNEVTSNLKSDEFSYNVFSCKEQKLTQKINVKKKPLLIIEGAYSLNPIINFDYDLKIFLKISEETQLQRLKIRNPNNYLDFINKWFILENSYFDHYKIEKSADLIIINE